MSDKTTPAKWSIFGTDALSVTVCDYVRRVHAEVCGSSLDPFCCTTCMELGDQVAPDLAARDAEIERLRTELARRAEADERMTELAADHVAEYAQRAADAEEWAGQLYTAWWSARIGRAMARLTLARTRDALSEAIVEEQELLHAAEAERDQLKATVEIES